MSIGNKAESLKMLSEFGFNVPAFSVVPAQLFNELRFKVDRSELLSQWLSSETEIVADKKYAVRSSGNKEDSSQASFAGLFTTSLEVVGKKNVVEAILACWDTVENDRVTSYCLQKKIDPKSIEMSVIVQEYIAGDFSGVVFSMNPQNGHEDEMIVELVKGSGEKLVSGQVNPDFFEIKVDETAVNIKKERKEQNVFSDDRNRDRFLSDLIEKVRSIQSHFRSPQDIEFTVLNGTVFFLQSRPITFFNYNEFDSVWTTADFRDGGVSSAVVSPIMWSLYGNVFSYSMEGYFRFLGLLDSFPLEKLKWYRVYYGKPYWNVELVKQVQLQLPGFREDTFDQDLSIPKVYEERGRESGWGIRKILGAIPVLLKISSGFSKQEKIAESWISGFSNNEKKWKKIDWSELSESDLLGKSKELIDDQFRLECDYFTTIYNASNAKMFFLETLTGLQKKVEGLSYTELIKSTQAMSVLSPLNSLNEIALKIQAKPNLLSKVLSILNELETLNAETVHSKVLETDPAAAQGITEYFEKYYHHSTKELDLRVPRWAEDKNFFYSTLKSTLLNPNVAKRGGHANPSLDKLKSYFEENLFDRLWTQKTFNSRLERLKKFLWLREEVRDRSTRMYYFIRQWIVFLNKKYQEDDLFFYLPVEDVFFYIQYPAQRPGLAAKGKKIKLYARGFEKFKNPNEVGLKTWSAPVALGATSEKTLMGLACSPGRIQGKVRVLKTIHDSTHLLPGEIMVVPYTDPGWTPLFGLSAGVITETGGLLSHAALIAREYSIPAVLNIPYATEKLKTGMKIELDGSAGSVLILNDV